MSNKKLFSYKEILNQLVDTVITWDGDAVSEFYNNYLDPEITYIEDSIWRTMDDEEITSSNISENLMDALDDLDGDSLEEIHNSYMHKEIQYFGDSLFQFN